MAYYEFKRLEDQINDQSELQQAELTNLRVEVKNLEGRLSYQINSRLEDIQDEYGKMCNQVSGLWYQISTSFFKKTIKTTRFLCCVGG